MKRSSRLAQIQRRVWPVAFVFGCRVVLAAPEKIPDLRPPHDEIPPSFWELHGWQAGVAAPVVLMLAGLAVLWLRRPAPVVVEPPAAIARRELEALRGRAGDAALAAEVSRIFRRYVWRFFEFAPDELTTAEIRQALQTRPQISPGLAGDIGDFLRRCDEWKFAPAPAPQFAVVPDALDLVEKIEMTRRPVPA
jgi:hypothetical protein